MSASELETSQEATIGHGTTRRLRTRPRAGASRVAAGARVRNDLSATAWMPQSDIDFATWVERGRQLGMIARGNGWWLGDWLLYGHAKYGERYARASRITGYDPQTLMNMVYVSSRFEISRRRETLSWSHHAEVAALEPAVQDEWLGEAERRKFSVRDLRQALRQARASSAREAPREDRPAAADAPDDGAEALDGAEAHALACPRCGYEFSAGGRAAPEHREEPSRHSVAP